MLNEKSRYYGTTKIISLIELKNVFNSSLFKYIDIVILFGSRAKENHHARSDYDFAVLVNNDAYDDWGIITKVWKDVGESLKLDEVDYDIIDLSTITNEMKNSILSGYKIIKGNKNDISRVLS